MLANPPARLAACVRCSAMPGLPVLGHLIELFRGGPDYVLRLYRSHGPLVYFRHYPARGFSPSVPMRPGDLRQQRSGLLAARLGSGDRTVFSGWVDTARLRRAPASPANHAAGLHPCPAERPCHPYRPDRDPRARPRVGRRRSLIPVVTRDEDLGAGYRIGDLHGV